MNLVADDVAFEYRFDTAVLKSVSAQILPGSFLAICGVNGCGKSTLLDCLDGVLQPKAGKVLLGDKPLSEYSRKQRAQQITYVEQHSHAPRLCVYDALLLGRRPFIEGSPHEEDYQRVDHIIEQMQLEDYALRYLDELSGGEYQKIMLARAFVQCDDVLLLDEPTNNLDMANQAEVMDLIRQAVDKRKIAAAAVLHDINLALLYCDRIVLMKDGEVLAAGSCDIVTSDLLGKAYGIEVDIIEYEGRKVVIQKRFNSAMANGDGIDKGKRNA